MEGTVKPLKVEAMAAALEWWRDAGVDRDYVDAPVQWLAADELAEPALPVAFGGALARAEPVAPATTAQRPLIGGEPAGWPADLASFAQWWLAEPSLDGGQVRGRVPPRGAAGAECMVIVAQPAPDDREQLLEGREGAFLSAMLAAMGLPAKSVYLASALPRHTPVPDWSMLAADGLGAVLAHHIALVAPQRLIVFGTGILPLLGHDPAQSAKNSAIFNHGGLNIPLLGALDLGVVADRPARKANFWQRWLEFSGSYRTGTATA